MMQPWPLCLAPFVKKKVRPTAKLCASVCMCVCYSILLDFSSRQPRLVSPAGAGCWFRAPRPSPCLGAWRSPSLTHSLARSLIHWLSLSLLLPIFPTLRPVEISTALVASVCRLYDTFFHDFPAANSLFPTCPFFSLWSPHPLSTCLPPSQVVSLFADFSFPLHFAIRWLRTVGPFINIDFIFSM